MLKEVMLGAGGIMLAAAIFASSVTPGTAPVAPVAPAAVVAPAPPPVAATVPAPPPQPVFTDDSGDAQFGAPMIEAAPVDSIDAEPISPQPESANENGGRQFTSKPGRVYPIPQ